MKSASSVCTVLALRSRYTFAVKSAFWLAILVSALAAAWILARVRRAIRARERAAEERAALLLAGLALPAATPANPAPQSMRAVAADGLAQQKLLFESAQKSGDAGEPALAIQLYARLLARYPSSGFSEQARAGVEAQKRKLVKD